MTTSALAVYARGFNKFKDVEYLMEFVCNFFKSWRINSWIDQQGGWVSTGGPGRLTKF